jgi:predicted PurR-regulated permease PerM
MIPAILIGLTMGPGTAALIAGLYIVVQVLESNLITPQIQKRLVSLSPALIIIAQLFMGVLTGGWGLLLATPLLLILNILLTELYVKRNGS